MTLAAIPGFAADSPIGRLDCRWKLAALFLAGLGVLFLQALPWAGAAFFGAALLAFLSRLSWRWCLVRLGGVAFFLVFFALPLPFVMPATDADWRLGALRLSPAGINLALLIVCKSLSLLLLALIAVGTAPLETTFKALHALRVPGVLVQLLLLTYRYVAVLGMEFGRLRVALRVRGFRNRVSRHSYRTIGHVAGTLLVRGSEQAERVGQAMRCRGFDGRFRSLTSVETRAPDLVFFVLVTTASAALVVGDAISRG
jgi:cobalt/nickel transport system permease protein